jgi:hypothetical protein
MLLGYGMSMRSGWQSYICRPISCSVCGGMQSGKCVGQSGVVAGKQDQKLKQCEWLCKHNFSIRRHYCWGRRAVQI